MIINEQDYLSHRGVKGTQWGVRKDPESSGSGNKSAVSNKKISPIKKFLQKRRESAQKAKLAKKLEKSQKAWDENFNRNWHHAYNKAADYANEVLIPQLDKKYGNMFSGSNAEKAYNKAFSKVLEREYKAMFGDRPS